MEIPRGMGRERYFRGTNIIHPCRILTARFDVLSVNEFLTSSLDDAPLSGVNTLSSDMLILLSRSPSSALE